MADLIALNAASRPTTTYEEALGRLAALQAQDGSNVNPVCTTYALTHGRKTKRAIVYFHGYTNCPQQFRRLGIEFHARGYTVLVPRQPYHGLLDRMTEEQARLTAEQLVQSANEAVDIACGLGEEVVVTGLSCGGVMAAWVAQFRSDVALAVIAAPAFGLPFVSPVVSDVGRVAMQSLPNFFVWWDPRLKEKLSECPHAYPRWATKTLSEIMRMGSVVRKHAQVQPPAAKRVVAMTNAADPGVNNKMVYKLTADWQRTAPDRVQAYEFPREQAILHDMIDPDQLRQKIDIVYPVWFDLVDGPASKPISAPA